jgi:hypothetical protein
MLLTNDIGGLFGERIERIRWRKCFLLTGLLLSIICGAKRPIHADETEPIMKSSVEALSINYLYISSVAFGLRLRCSSVT